MSTQGYYETSPSGHDVPLKVAMIARRDDKVATAKKFANVRKQRTYENVEETHAPRARCGGRRRFTENDFGGGDGGEARPRRAADPNKSRVRGRCHSARSQLSPRVSLSPSPRFAPFTRTNYNVRACKRSPLSRRPRLSISRDEYERPPTHGDATRRSVDRRCPRLPLRWTSRPPRRQVFRHWISPIGSNVASLSLVRRPRALVVALASPSSWTSSLSPTPLSCTSSRESPFVVGATGRDTSEITGRTTGGSMK